MTTSPVMTVTDELLAELEEAASNATPQHLDSADEIIKADSSAMIECPVCCGEGYASLENEYCNFDNHAIGVQFYGIGPEFGAAEEYYRRANPATISALTAELRRLRADNAELEQSLAESRANDQAAMGWLTSLRWASGDRGERMLPELVSHIEGLAKDAGRLEWMATEGAVIARMNGTGLPMCYQVSFPFESCQQLDWFPSWRDAVDDIMATQ